MRICINFVGLMLLVSCATLTEEESVEKMPETPEERLEAISERLELSDEQKQEVIPILIADMKARSDFWEKNESTVEMLSRRYELLQTSGPVQVREFERDVRRLQSKLDQIKADTDKQLKEHLSRKQFREFRKIRNELRDDFQSRLR